MSGEVAAGPGSALRELLADARVLEGSDTEPWSVRGRLPGAVALPESAKEAAAVLRLAGEEGWKVALAGSGTWLWADPSASAPDLVLSAARMDRIVHYEPADLTVTAQAGIRLSVLAETLARQGQWLPLDPPGRRRSLGATASTGTWGPMGAALGGPRDLALGLEAVTGDGRVFHAGGRVVKNVAGFDLVRLLVGSRGTLAFFTEVTMRLFPLPEEDRTLVVRREGMEALVRPAVAIGTHPVVPAAVELVERSLPRSRRREALLAVRIMGARDRVDAEEEALRGALREAGAKDLAAVPREEADALWREVRMLEEETDLTLRLTLPPARIEELVELSRALGRMRGGNDALEHSAVRMAMHGGAGALRIAVPNVRSDSGWDERWADRLEDLRRTMLWRGGSLSLERAPAAVAARLAAGGDPDPAEGLTRGLREVFDPAGVLSVDRFML